MKFSAAVLLSAVLGASAHPSGHEHANVHRSVQARAEFVVAKKPAPAPATPTPYTPAKPSPSQGSGSGGQYIPFCGADKRATLKEIAYKGNVGSPGKYGCNMMPISEDIASLYHYTVTFTNKDGHDLVGKCWNKIGPDGGINGFFSGNEAITFTLPANGKQVVAFDTNSQGGCGFGLGSVPLSAVGQIASTWLEFDFANLSNGGWSGADASCLVGGANKLPINFLQVCHQGQCSTVNNGGTGDNAYLPGMEAADGVGLNIAPGDAHLDCAVGGF